MEKTSSLIIPVILMITYLSCTSLPVTDNSDTNNAYSLIKCEKADFTEGWCDENTYHIRQTGAPSLKSKTLKERKLSSKNSAILSAQKRILEKFAELDIDINHAEVDTTAYAIAHEVKKSVKNGKIILEKWDENQNCEIIYEVYSKRLKRKVENAVFD
jgi:hypothetical protein